MLAFRTAFRMLERRIQLFLTIRFKELNRGTVERQVAEIGHLRDAAIEVSAS